MLRTSKFLPNLLFGSAFLVVATALSAQQSTQTPVQTPAVQAPPVQAPSTPAAPQTAAPAATINQPAKQTQPTVDPLQRQLSDKERRDQQKDLSREIKGSYKKWLNEDVRWIITDQELKAFKNLSNDEERDAFIENFWQRRNPSPDSPDNEFREEHYRRIAYANDHFAAGKPGWLTDRGHIYIAFGKPDSIESHPAGGTYDRPMEEGGGQTSTFPFETWHYRYLEGIGENIDIEFVDTCQCGDYHMTIDRSEKDALLHTPNGGETLYEQMGRATRADRFKGSMESLGPGPNSSSEASKEFDRIELFAKLQAAPEIKFKDLESFLVDHKVLNGPYFPFDVRVDYVKFTEDTDLVPITLQIKNKDITFVTKDGVSKGVVNVLCRVATITDKVVQTFEVPLEVEEPAELLPKTLETNEVYWKALPLKPGIYRVDIAIKDVNNPDHIGKWGQGITVPKYYDEKLATSSLILADKMERVPSKQIGTGEFVISNTFIRPRVSANLATPVSFRQTQKLNFWMQVYNLGIDEKSKMNSATVQYQIIDMATNKTVLDTSENSKTNSDELTLEKTLPLGGLTPGKYQVRIKVNDSISNQEIAQSAPFTVE
jgi:GWxTD domain-containing protein